MEQKQILITEYKFHNKNLNNNISQEMPNEQQVRKMPTNNHHTRVPTTKQTLFTSVNTEATSTWNIQGIRIPSLRTCGSLVSIEGEEKSNKYTVEKKLFINYLMAGNKKSKADKILQLMYSHFVRNRKNFQQNDLVLGTKIQSIGSVQDCICSQHVEMLNFYCSIWLSDMGYKTLNNKQKVLKNIKLQPSLSQLYFAIVFYQTFGSDYLSSTQRWELIRNTCINGWEYFCNKLIQYWKIHRTSQK